MITLVLDVDDIHPENGYGYNDIYESNLKKLIKLGFKPTLYVVPFWEGRKELLLDKHKGWINSFGKDVEWSIHGLKHHNENCKDLPWLEFKGISNYKAIESIEFARFIIKRATGYDPKGIRFPGWLCDENTLEYIFNNCEFLEYYALFAKGNFLHQHKGKTIVPFTYNVHTLPNIEDLSDNQTIFLHSHISPGHNKQNLNCLSDDNTNSIIKFVNDIKKEKEVTFKTTFGVVKDYVPHK